MAKKLVKKVAKKKGDGGKAIRELFTAPAWTIKASATKRAQFSKEFASRLDQRIINTFGTYPSENAKVAQSVVQHAYHVLFNML